MTDKQRKFCDEYLIDCNATQAAIRAGYSKKYANTNANKILQNTTIKKYINEQLEKISSEKIADAKEIREYLTSVMRGEQIEPVLRLVGDGIQIIDKIAASTKERLKAAELLGKTLCLFNDKINVEVEPVTIINDLKE